MIITFNNYQDLHKSDLYGIDIEAEREAAPEGQNLLPSEKNRLQVYLHAGYAMYLARLFQEEEKKDE